MGRMSREKGKRGEREVASLFRDWGYDAHRTAQCRGNTGRAADIDGTPGVHVEVKYQEHMRLYEWMQQAADDANAAGDGSLPVVVHKQSHRPVLATMEFSAWMELYREWEAANFQQEDRK